MSSSFVLSSVVLHLQLSEIYYVLLQTLIHNLCVALMSLLGAFTLMALVMFKVEYSIICQTVAPPTSW